MPEVNSPYLIASVTLKKLCSFSHNVVYVFLQGFQKNSDYFPKAHSNNHLFLIIDRKSVLFEV
jgi:hypothetical protein